jgi:hypothetical protein
MRRVADQQGDQLSAADRLAGHRIMGDHTAVRLAVRGVVRLDRRAQLELPQPADRGLSGQPRQILQAGLAAGGDARRRGHYT